MRLGEAVVADGKNGALIAGWEYNGGDDIAGTTDTPARCRLSVCESTRRLLGSEAAGCCTVDALRLAVEVYSVRWLLIFQTGYQPR